jgi:hypothetical protein
MYIPDGAKEDYGVYGEKDIWNKDVFSEAEVIAKTIAENNLSLTDIRKIADKSWIDSKHFENLYMWGWLGNKVESSGWESKDLKRKIINKLRQVSFENVVNHYCGFHTCEVCGDMGAGFEGSIKILHKGKVYCCPHGVEHYIEEHDYKPDDEVIDAVFNGTYLDKYMIVHMIVLENAKKLPKMVAKAKKVWEEEQELRKEAKRKRLECEERIQKLFTSRQKELIKEAVNGTGDIIPLND